LEFYHRDEGIPHPMGYYLPLKTALVNLDVRNQHAEKQVRA
jgi:hypothetical protein